MRPNGKDLNLRRQAQLARRPGFTQSQTALEDDQGNPVPRWLARYRLKEANRKHRYTHDRHADAKARGLLKLRAVHFRGTGRFLVPLAPEEVKLLLEEAKKEWEENEHVLATDTYMALNAAGYDADKVTALWEVMETAEINPDGIEDHPDLIQEEDIV